MKKSFQDMAERLVNAENDFLQIIQDIANCTQAEAIKVFKVYRNCKVLKYSAGIGRFSVIHGGFLDKETIQLAINS